MDSYESLLEFYKGRGYRTRIGFGEHPALIVIDFSYGFTASRGGFPGGEFDAEIAQTNRLLNAMRGHFPVFFTTIAYDDPAREGGWWCAKVPWLEQFRRPTESIEIDSRLGRHDDDVLLVKPYPSSFHGTPLDEMLRTAGVDTLVIAGCTTSVCVRATALDAMQHGYRAIVAGDAVGDLHPQLHELHLCDLDARYADVVSTNDVLQHLGRRDSPEPGRESVIASRDAYCRC
ncbi:MAG: isochorismatase family protein [Alphaproteobacteria bacterium]